MNGETHRNKAKCRAQSKLTSTPIQQYGSEPYMCCLYNDCRNNKLTKDKPTNLKKGISEKLKHTTPSVPLTSNRLCDQFW